jgi:hypothetical protein
LVNSVKVCSWSGFGSLVGLRVVQQNGVDILAFGLDGFSYKMQMLVESVYGGYILRMCVYLAYGEVVRM